MEHLAAMRFRGAVSREVLIVETTPRRTITAQLPGAH